VRVIQKPPTPPENEYERIVFEEIMSARAENRAVSRHMLSQQLHESHGISPKEAFAVVETYCDNEAPIIPEYLGNEFIVSYLKTMALIFAAASILVMLFSAVKWLNGDHRFLWGFLVSAGILAMSTTGWIKSLLREKSLGQ